MPKSSRPKSKVLSQENQRDLVCTCNKVSRQTIEGVITRGCQTLPKIFTATTAGVGQCGGSCRPELEKILRFYLKTGRFPNQLK